MGKGLIRDGISCYRGEQNGMWVGAGKMVETARRKKCSSGEIWTTIPTGLALHPPSLLPCIKNLKWHQFC